MRPTTAGRRATGSSRIAPSGAEPSRSPSIGDVARIDDRAGRQRRRRPGRLAHRHALGHRADRGVGVVGRREAAPGDEDVGGVADDAASGRGCRPRRRPAGTARSCRRRRGGPRSARRTGRSRRRTVARARTSSPGQPVVAVDPARLADPDARSRSATSDALLRSRARGRRGSGRTRAPGDGRPSRPRSGTTGSVALTMPAVGRRAGTSRAGS